MRELFVYYRVRDADGAAARAAVLGMQDRLRGSHPDLHSRLLTRIGPDAGMQTWLEVYSLPTSAEGVGQVLERQIEAHAADWSALIAGPRQVEAFIASVA